MQKRFVALVLGATLAGGCGEGKVKGTAGGGGVTAVNGFAGIGAVTSEIDNSGVTSGVGDANNPPSTCRRMPACTAAVIHKAGSQPR